jgi:5-dehydro-2-deoxygluconokinase
LRALRECLRRASVVSRHGCAAGDATRIELDHYLANAHSIPRPDRDAALTRLHRKTAPRVPRPELFPVSPFDHRATSSTSSPAPRSERKPHPGTKESYSSTPVARTKRPGVLEGRIGSCATIVTGQDALNAATGPRLVDRPSVELAGSNPVCLRVGTFGGTALIAWPVEQGRQMPRSRSIRRRGIEPARERSAGQRRCTTPCRSAATSS